jgi:hypothetical protein
MRTAANFTDGFVSAQKRVVGEGQTPIRVRPFAQAIRD